MASITINFSAAVANRIRNAMKTAWQLDRTPTLDEDLKGLVIRDIQKFVTAVERSVGRDAVDVGLKNLNIT